MDRKFIDLSYKSIIKDIDIPKDILNDLDNNVNEVDDGDKKIIVIKEKKMFMIIM